MKNKNWLTLMLSDGSEISHKRVITFGAFILLTIAFLLNLFWDIKVSENLIGVMEGLVFAGFGSTTVEKFAGFGSKKTPEIKPEEKPITTETDQPVLPE